MPTIIPGVVPTVIVSTAVAASGPVAEISTVDDPENNTDGIVSPPAQGEAIARRIPCARLSVLEGAGHLANLEEPEAFNRLLLDHLTTRPAVEVA